MKRGSTTSLTWTTGTLVTLCFSCPPIPHHLPSLSLPPPLPPPSLPLPASSVYYQSPLEVKRSHAGHKNRLSTVFWYLSDCEGGHTAFPLAPILRPHVSALFPEPTADPKRYFFHPGAPENHIGHTLSCEYALRIPPKVGSAILFYSILPNGLGDQYSQHAACAVKGGTKWAANKWVWNKPI
jgi:hypothetical protein